VNSTHLDVELEHHRPVVGKLHRFHLEIGLADRRELMIVGELRQAVHQQLALHLVGDVLLEPRLDELARRAAGAKTGQLRLRHQLAEGVLDVPIDVVLGDRHGHVPLASAGRIDLHLQRQPGLFLGGFVGWALYNRAFFAV
jgi:hypothetical protein